MIYKMKSHKVKIKENPKTVEKGWTQLEKPHQESEGMLMQQTERGEKPHKL